MKKTLLPLAALVAFASAPAGAQVCLGFGNAPGQLAVAGTAHFPEALNAFGAEASYNFANPLAVNAGYRATTARGGESFGTMNTVSAGAAAELVARGVGTSPSFSVCPTVQGAYSSIEGFKGYEVPVGVGLGATVPLGTSGVQLHPYLVPQVVFGRFEIDVDGTKVKSDWESAAMARGGALLSFDRFYVGGELSKVFEDDEKVAFGVRVGFRM